MRSCLFLLTIFFLAVFISTTHAVTVYVPDDFDRIQEAIDVCIDGDTVIVRDGTYTGDGNRDIDFTGKAIVLMSENGPEVTIIDCQGDSLDPHRGFYFHSGEDSSSVVQGFTITKGWAVFGGGMYNLSSSPRVTNCTFSENEAYYGGGMYNLYTSSQTVNNCTFNNNSARHGGGIWNYTNKSWLNVINCTFNQNWAEYGGGMFNDAALLNVINCAFSGNSTTGQYSEGGGMYNAITVLRAINCTFSNNSARHGGGMFNEQCFEKILNCIFSGNSAGNGGGMCNHQEFYGGYYFVWNCTFIENTANNGGGVHNQVYLSDSFIFTNCTFSENSANSGGGMYNEWLDETVVNNCILWGDIPDEIYGGASVTYSDVEGGNTGVGNIDADPLFVSFNGFDYLLGRGSPCIDAGDPDIEDGKNWPIWYNNGLRSDMGAYGGPGNVGWLQ
jgi:hypothetical protein